MQPDIHVELAHHVALRERILAECPDLDEQTLADTLEGATSLKEAIIAVVKSLDEDEAMLIGLGKRREELDARYERIEHRFKRKRDILGQIMEAADIKRLTEPDFTLSLVPRPRAVIVTDEAQIPPDFMVQPDPPPPRPDKKLIKDAISDGFTVPGAMLSNGGYSVTLRKK